MRAKRIHLNLNPANPDDFRVLEYLENADTSYSKAAVKAILWYLDGHEPVVGSKAFLQKVLTTIQDSLKEVSIVSPQPEQVESKKAETVTDNSILDFLDAMG